MALLQRLLLLCYCLLPILAVGQTLPYSSLQHRKIAVADSVTVDSLSIAAGTFHIAGIPEADYHFYPEKSLLTWKKKPATDSIQLTYRVLPFAFHHTYSHKSRKAVETATTFTYVPKYNSSSQGNFVDFNQIEYNGSYGRSVSLGNNQDVVLNSNFNLQANGYLLDSIKLEAAISDNTVPFQPEGNTQRLQEFDQIYIKLTKGPHLLQLGDFNIEKPRGYFLNTTKRVQGIYYQTDLNLGKQVKNALGLSGSVAKGQFARNIFQGAEGNQGPYKLTGNNGEQFFIVLANTEKVYINGLLQQRGENADYVINYNTGELSFMPRRLITKDSRIQVEFEYQDRTYLNSLIYAWDELRVGKKLNFRFNAYSNQDAKNQSYTQTLNDQQKTFLGTIGDSIDRAYYPLITPDTFSASKILYKITDSTVNGVLYDSVFVYSTNPDSAKYSIGFSFVGANKGDYHIAANNANGRVYQWTAPLNGVHQGDYAPLQLLITPKKLQVFNLNTTYQIDSFKSLNVELALSNQDPNLFSKTDNQTHTGLASRIQYSEQRFIGKADSLKHKPWTLQNDITYEFVQDRFRAIAPYRNVEFARDWNVPQTDIGKPDEHLAGLNTSIRHLRYGQLNYGFGFYQRGSLYRGYRNILSYAFTDKRWNTGFTFNLTTSSDTLQRTTYFRPSAFAEYRFTHLQQSVAGVKYQAEHNLITYIKSDSLTAAALSFDLVSAYFKSPDNAKTGYTLTHTYRRDQLPYGLHFKQQSHSNTTELSFGLMKWKNHKINFTGSYRELAIDDTTLNNQRAEQTLLGRLEYTGNLLHNVIQVQTLYEFGSGQEQKRSYTYVEVPAGQGTYYWIDYNGDGVQQSNEFEIALYSDQKKFIRVFTPTNEYVKVNYVNFNQSLNIDPVAYWNNHPADGWQKMISRFSDQASLQVSNRLLADQGFTAYNPFVSTLRNENIITTATSLSNTLYFNRSNAGWGIDYNYLHTNSKQLLTYGVEGSGNTQHTVRLRLNLSPSFTFNTTAQKGLKGYESALSDGRTYSIHNANAEPGITWMYRGVLRLTGTVHYEDRHNEEAYGNEHATIARVALDARYSRPVTGAISIRGSYSEIAYDGLTTTSSVAYSMLDALLPGANYQWYANWERRIGKGIEVSLEYEGRKSGENKAVHTGKLTIRAIL